jgi:hypothetical protein
VRISKRELAILKFMRIKIVRTDSIICICQPNTDINLGYFLSVLSWRAPIYLGFWNNQSGRFFLFGNFQKKSNQVIDFKQSQIPKGPTLVWICDHSNQICTQQTWFTFFLNQIWKRSPKTHLSTFSSLWFSWGPKTFCRCVFWWGHIYWELSIINTTLFLPWNECQVLFGSLQFVANLHTIGSDKDDAAMYFYCICWQLTYKDDAAMYFYCICWQLTYKDDAAMYFVYWL